MSEAPAVARLVAPPTAYAVEATGLTKVFGELRAVDDISFEVAAGEVFAFLGPNGAGKSTTINMLCTLSRPSGGRAEVAGFDVATRPKAVRRHIGLVFQEQTLDGQLTAEENLRFHAVLYGVPAAVVSSRVSWALGLVGLAERRRTLVAEFSGGMARRLEIARALLHAPKVLFLDEPTIGLDPQTRALMWEDVLRLRDEKGVTVFLTTHYMDEAEYADRIAIIDQGKIVALGSPEALKTSVGQDTVELATSDDSAGAANLTAAGFSVVETADGMVIQTADGEALVAQLVTTVGLPVRHVRVRRPTLDDVFLHYTGRVIREEHGDGRAAMSRAWSARRR